MRSVKSLVFVNTGTLYYENEQIYMISYIDKDDVETCLYIGQSKAPPCRLGVHFGVKCDDCASYNKKVGYRSGASRQFRNMFNRQPKEIKENFTISLVQLPDLCQLTNFDTDYIRRRILKLGIAVSDYHYNNINKKTLDFCEELLSIILRPTYCDAWYSKLFKNSPLPKELKGY